MALIPLEEYLARQRSAIDTMVPARSPQGLPGPAPTEQPGFIGGPLERGWRGTQSNLVGAAGLLAQGLGFDEISQGLYDKSKEYAEARDAIPRRVPRIEDIQDMSDLGIFALETLVENAPLIASIAIPGGIAAKAASIAGAGARASQVTGTIAAFLADVGLQTGESVEIARDAGADPGDIRVIGSGLGKGILDFVPILTVAKRMGLLKGLPLGPIIEREISKTLVQRGFIGRVAGEMGTIAVREIPTEVAQEAVNIGLDRALNEFSGALTEDEVSQLMNAAAGAAAFSLLGIPAAVSRTSLDETDENDIEIEGLEEGARQVALPAPEVLAQLASESRGLKQLPPPADSERVFRVAPDGGISEVIQPKQAEKSIFTVSPEGQVIPQGLIPERGDLRQAIRNAMEEIGAEPERGVLFGTEGTSSSGFAPEALDLAARSIISLPAELRSQVDNSIVLLNSTVQEGKKRARKLPATPLMEDPTQGLHADLQPLMNARTELLADQSLRTKKGELNAKGRKQLETIDLRMSRVAELLGIASPVNGKGIEDSQEIEKELEQLNAAPPQPVSNLTQGEQEYVERLEEKEVLEGLTDEEERTLEALYLKRLKLPKRPRARRLNAHEIRKLADAPPFTVQEGPEAGQFLSDGVEDGVLRQREAAKWRRTKFPPTEDGEIYQWYGFTSQPEVDSTYGVIRKAPLREGQGPWDVLTSDGRHLGNFFDITEARAALQAAVEANQTTVRHQKKGTKSKARFSVEQVASAVKELTANFPRRPTFIVTPNTGVFRGVKGREHLIAEKNTTVGMYFMNEPDTIYIFSDRIQSTQQLARTLLHEMFHFGFHNYMTSAEKNQFLQMVMAAYPEEMAKRLSDFHPELTLARDANPNDMRVIRRLREAMLREAEEIVAEKAEKDPKASFLDRIVALFMRVVRRLMPSVKITEAEIRTLIRDVGAWSRNRSAVTERNLRQFTEPFRKREFEKIVGRKSTYESETLAGIQNWGEVWGQKFLNGVLTPLQMANSAFVKKNLPSSQLYLEFVQKWWARKRNLTNTPVELAEQWSKMSKRDAERLARTIFEVSAESEEKGERLSDDAVKAIFARNGLDPSDIPTNAGIRTGSRNLFQLWRDVDESFQQIVNDMEKGLQVSVIRQAIREQGIADPVRDRARAESLAKLWRSEAKHTQFFDEVVKSPDLANLNLGGRLLEIEGQMQRLRNRNYFPRMRFGKYAITVRAKGNFVYGGEEVNGPSEGKRGSVVWFETHEGPRAQGDRIEELRRGEFRDSSKFEVQATRLSDNEFVFLGMPPGLYEVLRGELELSPEQEERLKEVYRKFSPGSAFLKHLIKRKDIAGFSTDAMRIYASYMMNAANHLARVEFHQDMGDSLNNIRRESNLPINATRAGEVREYFARHYKYLMNPGNDWAKLRSLGFLWYLGFNVKSALVNLTQVPMVAYPFLAHRYGDKAAVGALLKATSDVAKMRRGRKVLDVDTDRDLARALADGFVDESRATELAGLAEGDILQRLMPESASAKIVNKAAYLGSFLFRHAEKLNREVVFLAARELALQKGLRGEQVYRAAREAVQTTMFEYSKWNRPEYTRGKKSVFFLFTNYIQHLAYLAYGGEGAKVAMRVWMGLLMAAGVQGLPFAENFFDIFDWSATEVKEMLGSQDPRTSIREDLRELATTLTDQPDLIMHGLGRYYGLGPMHFLSLFDVPVPNVNISSSLSAGEVLPGLREAFAANEDPDSKLGKVVIDALGPVVGIGYNLWRASVDDNPDTWKVWERAMPSAISNVSKAFRRGSEGGENFRGGGKLIEFEPQNVEHQMENIAQALGFAPTRLAQRQELRYSQEQLKQYWTARRAALMEGYAYALLARDQEAVDLAKKKIREFNNAVPSRILAINHDSLTSSIKERFRRATLREHGIPTEKMFRPLYRQIEQQYPEGSAAAPTR